MQGNAVNCCNCACSSWEWSLSDLYLISQCPKSPSEHFTPEMLEGAPAVYIYLAGNRRSTAVSRPLPDIPFCCRQALRLVTCSLFRAQGVNDDEVTLPELPISHLDVPCTLPCNHRALRVLKLSSVPLSGGRESSSTPPGETDSVDTEILEGVSKV